MYLAHYNLKVKPFEITPDPSFFWLGEKHKEGWAALEYGILENKGFLLLTGDIGTGKTVLINYLIKSTEVSPVIATILDPDLESLDFFNILSEEFQMNKQFDSKGNFLIEFRNFLYEIYGANGKVLLIIDEAQRLNFKLLGLIRALSNIEMPDRKLMNIFFVGQSEFINMLREERNEAVRKRIAVSYHLDPLSGSETEQYIIHRLNVAGATRAVFTPYAIREIYAFTGGYPRLINIICDHALLAGYSKELYVIDKSIILECEKDLYILSDKQHTKKEETTSDLIPEAYVINTPEKKQSSIRSGSDELNSKPKFMRYNTTFPCLLKVILNMSEREQLLLLQYAKSIADDRTLPRNRCLIPANCKIKKRNFDGVILDINSYGAYIDTNESFPIGQEINLSFFNPFSDNNMELDGKVIWSNPNGIGVRFNDLSRFRVKW